MANGEWSFYESVRAVLERPVSDKEERARLRKLGVENTLLNAIHLALGEKAASGDLQAAKYLRDIAMTSPCGKAENEKSNGGLELSALTDDELRAIAVQVAQTE